MVDFTAVIVVRLNIQFCNCLQQFNLKKMNTTKNEKFKEFLRTLKSEIDLPYFAEDCDSFEELRDSIDDGGGFDVEIIYYSNAIDYLKVNDSSLRESLEIAAEYGYEVDSLNSEILASLLASKNAREEFDELESEISDWFDNYEEEEEEEEN